ncbi:MAG TPA: nucleotidyltransferase domain-containing protein [Thermoanaerobaculia bacterium]|nr:nucleotidyltransferase domain-containing protein [Thermoanaerobaculia bacterium]
MAWIDHLQKALEARDEVRLAVLFGSSARRGAGRDADVALLVEPDSPSLRRRLEAELGRAAGCAVDLVYLDEAPPLLRFEIARDGQVLVERVPHLWADVRARAMIDWWDWAPTARRLFATAAERVRGKVPSGPA